MKKNYFFLIIFLLGLSLIGCKKSSSDPVDLAAKAIGTYSGTFSANGGNPSSCSTEITQQSSSVTVKLLADGNLIFNVPNTTVSDGGGGKVTLRNDTYLFTGTVDGKSLDYYLSTAHFVGTKP